jgi:hypothetical protein
MATNDDATIFREHEPGSLAAGFKFLAISGR